MITIDNNYQQQIEANIEEEFTYYEETVGKTDSYTVEITDGVFLITEYKEDWIWEHIHLFETLLRRTAANIINQ